MAGIGEYIHYNHQAYLQYGTNEPGVKVKSRVSADVFTKMQRSVLAKAKSRLSLSSSNNYKELENYLNGIMYPSERTGAWGSLNDTARMKTIEALIGKEALKFVTNWSQGGMVYEAGFSGKNRFTPGTALRLKNTAERLIQILVNSKDANKTKDLQKLKTLIGHIDSLANEAKINLNDYENSLKRKNINQNEKIRNLLSTINQDLKDISNASFLQGLGKSFEAFIAGCDDALTSSVEDVTSDLVERILTGTKSNKNQTRHNISSKINYASADGAAEMYGARNNSNSSGTFSSVYKMDVNLTFKDEAYRISAKNYAMRDGDQRIHILNGSPFLDILQKNLSINQTNHMLNALTNKGKHGSVLLQAQQTAKTIIALEALMGLSQSKGYTDYLIINNRSARQIQVKPISEIIKPIEQGNIHNLPISISGYNPKDFTDLNVWYSRGKTDKERRQPNMQDAYYRIGNLLVKLKNIKISASLNTKNWNWKT